MKRYAIVGKRTAKIDLKSGKKKTVLKAFHIIGQGGLSLCLTENAYKKNKPSYTFATEKPPKKLICKNCGSLLKALATPTPEVEETVTAPQSKDTRLLQDAKYKAKIWHRKVLLKNQKAPKAYVKKSRLGKWKGK